MNTSTFKNITVAITGALYGLLTGFILSIIYNLAYGNPQLFYPSTATWTHKFPSVAIAVAVSAVLWMILGLVNALASSLIFSSETLNLTHSTILHFIIICLTTNVIALLAGWMPLRFDTELIFIGFFAVVYFVIWLVHLMHYKRQARLLNEALEKKK